MKIYLAFGANVLFSLCCAYFAFFETDYLIDTYLAVLTEKLWVLKGLGIGLALFALNIFIVLLKEPNIKNYLHITFADILWILTSSIIAFWFYDSLGDKGLGLIMLINLSVATLAILQYISLFSLTKHPDKFSQFDTLINIEYKIHASRKQFWNILANLPDIHKYAANVASSEIIAGKKGIGTKRLCSDGKKAQWTEEVYEWKDGESISMSFDPKVAGFPFPVTQLRGGWVIDADADRSTDRGTGNFNSHKVRVWFELDSKNKLVKILMPLLAYIWTNSLTPAIKKMDLAARLTPGTQS